MKKRILSVLLAVLMLLSIVPMSDMGIEASAISYSGSSSYMSGKYYTQLCNVTLTGNGATDIVNVAKSQIGYKGGSSNNDLSGSTTSTSNVKYTEYGRVIGSNPNEWCAYFVSWCARQAGISNSVLPNFAGCTPAYNTTLPNSGCTMHSRTSGYRPKKGDIIFFGDSSSNIYHVGIVKEDVSSSNIVYYIDGNNNSQGRPNRVHDSNKSLSDSSIWGYAVPNYKNTAVPSKPVLSISDKNTSDKAVTFTWNKTDNTSYYDLRIYNHGDYNVGAPYYKFGIGASTTSTTMKFPAGKYAAYITAVSSSGESTASDWITVLDVVDPPGKSVLTATPGENPTDGVTFSWTKAANAHTYDLRVYNYGDYNVGAPYYKFGMSSDTTSTTIKLPVGKYSAYITAIASNGAYEGGGSEWITFTVSEPTIDSSYPANIKGYKMWIGETATQVYDTQTLSAYYLDDNEITIVSIYKNDWAKIKHTVNGTEKIAYVPVGGLICDKIEPTTMYLNSNSDIYTRYKCETKQSSQLKDKEVLVIGYYKTDLAQVCYTVNNTNYIGWIEKDKLAEHTAEAYTITFNANGGSGAPSAQKKTQGTDLTLNDTEPTREGYSFRGWSASSTATTPTYLPGGIYNLDSGATLYAVWKKVFYGDIYNDGVINSGDVLYIAQVVEGIKTASSYAILLGDVNGDGQLTSDDVDLITQYNMKNIHSFPVENLNAKMSIYNTPDKTLYRQDDSINTTGLELAIMYYDDKDSAIYKSYHIINNGYKITPEKSLGSGTQNIAVCIGDWETSYEIIVDSEVPTKGAVSFYYETNDSTTMSITLRDNYSVDGYYWGTDSNVENNSFYKVNGNTSETIFKTVSKEGSYYFAIKDTAGNLSYVYRYKFHKLTLNANEGSVEKDSYFVFNGDIIVLPFATRSGYLFKGWSTNNNANTVEYLEGETCIVNSNMTLYAVWEKNNVHAHTYKAETVLTPTCTSNGLVMFTCSCGDNYSEDIKATGHNWKAATCTSKKTCSNCGTTEGSVLAHSYTSKVTTAATCTTSGTKTFTCSTCSDSYTQSIPATGHNWKAATCTSKKTCLNCGSTVDSALGHDYISAVTKEATCAESGITTYTCSRCAESFEESISAINHKNKTAIIKKEATCVEVGYTEGVYCPDCENWLEGHEEIAKLPHTFTEKIIDSSHLVSDATTKSPAIYKYDCANCDAISEDLTFTYGDKLSSLGKPEKITVTQTATTVKLTWTAVEGANIYRVYQKNGSTWKKLGDVEKLNGTITKLTAGIKYDFAVKAGKKVDGKITWSDVYSTINTATKAAAPTNVSATQSTTSVKLSWAASSGADGYRVHLKTATGWKKLGDVTKLDGTIKNLKAGTKYTYAVQPYIKTESGVVWGAYTEITTATKPVNPTVKVTASSKGKLTVTWDAVDGAEAYQLYYKKGDGSYKLYNTYSKSSTLTFSNLSSGTKYTFAVRGVIKTNGGDVRSGYKEASATVK